MATQIATHEVESLALGIAEWRKALAPAGESTIVFRDSAFANDVAKTNLTAVLVQHGFDEKQIAPALVAQAQGLTPSFGDR